MSIVVDASVLVALLADAGASGRWAEQSVATQHLAAPHLVLAEAANILRRFEAAGRLTRVEATAAATDLASLDLALFPYVPFAGRIWELRSTLTCYDAWYVAVAEELDCPLATLDGRLSRASGPRCRFLLPPPE